MSVLDRAIVKAFERRELSIAEQKQCVKDATQAKTVVSPEAGDGSLQSSVFASAPTRPAVTAAPLNVAPVLESPSTSSSMPLEANGYSGHREDQTPSVGIENPQSLPGIESTSNSNQCDSSTSNWIDSSDCESDSESAQSALVNSALLDPDSSILKDSIVRESIERNVAALKEETSRLDPVPSWNSAVTNGPAASEATTNALADVPEKRLAESGAQGVRSSDAPPVTSRISGFDSTSEEHTFKRNPYAADIVVPESRNDTSTGIRESAPSHEAVQTSFNANPPQVSSILAAQQVEPGQGPESALQKWHWPAICEQLDQFTGDGFRELAMHLQYTAAQGQKVLAFASSQRETGRTSVLLTLTRILALEGKCRVLLIDADNRHPNIASLVKVKPQVGLERVLRGSAPFRDATISMTPGRIELLPLISAIADTVWHQTARGLRSLVQQVKRDYDLILLDVGVFGPESQLSDCWLRGVADGVITVARQLTAKRTEHFVPAWKQIGIDSLGVIETFA